LDVPLEWRDECRVLPAFASVSAFLRGCRCSGMSSSSDSSLSYSRIFLSLVFRVDPASGSSLQPSLSCRAVWQTVSTASSSVLPVSGVLTWIMAVASCWYPESGCITMSSGIACGAGFVVAIFLAISGCREKSPCDCRAGKMLSTCRVSASGDGRVTTGGCAYDTLVG